MSWYLADETDLLGQFASGQGFTDLRAAARRYPAVKEFFDAGATKNVLLCIVQLSAIAKKAAPDVADTAKGLADLMRGESAVWITQGFTGPDA